MRDQEHYYKDRSELREGDSAVIQHKSTKGYLKDYSLKHKVTMEWNMSEDSIHDRMFLLKIDDNITVVLDYEEFLRNGRFI